MENEQSKEVILRSSAQEDLVKNLFKTKKLTSKERNWFKKIWENQILTMKDAVVFIKGFLGFINLLRLVNSKNKRNFKICHYCNSMDDVLRTLHVSSGDKFWCCYNCLINLDSEEFVMVPRKKNNGI